MILVDTSVWIDHLHRSEPALVAMLDADDVGCHPFVIEELTLGSINQRRNLPELLDSLHVFPVLTHDEAMVLVDGRRLWGRGPSVAGVRLLGSVALAAGGETLDPRQAAGRGMP